MRRVPLVSALALLVGLTACLPGPDAGDAVAPAETTTAAPESLEPTPSAEAAPSEEAPPSEEAAPSEAPPAEEAITFIAVIDGDTVETSAGTVRLIGIDTPERGECGHDEASMTIGQLIANGDTVELVYPEGQNDRDSHGRLLRYLVTADGTDIGMVQIEAGHAVARYDSTDGYPTHPMEAGYRAGQLATLGADGLVVTTACSQALSLIASTPETSAAVEETPWYMECGSCSQLKKNKVGHPKGPFDVNDPDEVDIYNWFNYGTGHRGDGDGDGLACE